VDTIEARLTALEDELEIRRLLARFAFLEDSRRDEEWVTLWTDDGVYDMDTRYRGHGELLALMADPAGNRRPDFYGHCMHVHGGALDVAINGDTAVAQAYTVLHQEVEGRVTVVGAAANRWTLRRLDGRWLVAERVRRPIGAAGFAEVLR
jgi:hypothetical protein